MMFVLKIKERREELGLSTRQLSELTGIRWNTVKDMEDNKAKHWSIENLNKIKDVLKVKEVTELIDIKDDNDQ